MLLTPGYDAIVRVGIACLALAMALIWLGVFALTLGLILKQPNLSTAALCGILLWLMALGAGLPLWMLFGSAGGGLTVAVASISISVCSATARELTSPTMHSGICRAFSAFTSTAS